MSCLASRAQFSICTCLTGHCEAYMRETCIAFRAVLVRGSVISAIIIISSCYQFLNFYLYIFLIYIYPTIFAGFNHSQRVIRLKIMLHFSPLLGLGLCFHLTENSMRSPWANEPRAMISQRWSKTISRKDIQEVRDCVQSIKVCWPWVIGVMC